MRSSSSGGQIAGLLHVQGHLMSVLVQENAKRTLFRMAFSMLAGTFAMSAYNLTDTYFVAKPGTLPLAAMAFTFPVVMLLTFVADGIGMGVTTLVSHAIGRHDHASMSGENVSGLEGNNRGWTQPA
jgi:Na+-driven multidrug efflux pump